MTRLAFARYETRADGYARWRCWDGTRERYVYVHRLLAVAEFGFEAVVDKHVHHESEVRYDIERRTSSSRSQKATTAAAR